jgi:Ca2+:H+ antiporter
VAVGISALIAMDGESNWLEGALLMLVYLVLAISFFELRLPVPVG